MAIYELAVMGAASARQIGELEEQISQLIEPFGLRLGTEVGWSTNATAFVPQPQKPAAVTFYGGEGVSSGNVADLLRSAVPVLPVASAVGRVEQEIPTELRPINCLTYAGDGSLRIATALLECVGLLPRQRRVFVSYRREAAREAALQLFNVLSARLYDVFLDTHGISPGDDFQSVLWHRLCDCDVLVVLDTPDYFESRWTAAEYGRALSKNISVLRIGWPGVNPSPRASTASGVDLGSQDIDQATGRLTEEMLARIALQVEQVRAQSYAVRCVNLFSKVQQAVECIRGTFRGVGAHHAVFLTLPDGTDVVAFPSVGVPTSLSLHHAVERSSGRRSVAVVYDHIGLHSAWIEHLAWLGTHIQAVRWIRASEAAWTLAGWSVQ